MITLEVPSKRERRKQRGLSAGALKGWSVGAAAIIFLGSLNYASGHLYNSSAPLQPAAQGAAAAAQATQASSRFTTTTRSRQGTSSFPNVTTTTRTPLTRSRTS